MLLDWIKSSVTKIKDKLMGVSSAINVGGFSIIDNVLQNRKNTKRMKEELAERSVKNKWTPEVFDEQLATLRKRRKSQTLTTYKNIGSSVRGYGRSLLAIGRSGRFYNVTVLDEKTTHVCLGYVGMSWPKPYSAIPEKPPRVQRLIHRCRSYLEFRSSPPEDNGGFMQQFNEGGDELQRQLLKPKRYEAYKAGKLSINSYAQFEKVVLFNLDELGISDK